MEGYWTEMRWQHQGEGLHRQVLGIRKERYSPKDFKKDFKMLEVLTFEFWLELAWLRPRAGQSVKAKHC